MEHRKAWGFSDNNKMDSSFVYFNKAKEEYLKHADSINVGKCLINMAIISGDQGDYFGSQELSLSAITYLNPTDEVQKEVLSSNYNNLGKMAHLLKKYDEADSFYIKSIRLTSIKKSRDIYMNNIAINLTHQKKYNEALTYFDRLMRDKAIMGNRLTFSRILSNASKTRWLKNSNYNPVPSLIKALEIRIQENDFWGQNASFSHLSDYYALKQPDSALFYAHKMYIVAQNINKSASDKLEALQKLIRLSPPKESKHYFEIYEDLDDSLQTVSASAKNQFALIRYETEKHKTDNLILQKDNTEKKYQLIKQKTILFGTITLLVLGAVFSVYWYNKRKKAHQKEKELEVKNTELKYVKKVHDRVANKVYNVMMEVENTDDLNKTTLADKLESIYKISRDISYENNDIDSRQIFAQQLHQMLMSYTSDAIEISVDGNNEGLWQNADETVKSEIIIILQELMTNMMKHSQATAVQLDFKRINNRINIIYLDNGIGIAGEPIFKNGLKNTGNRIEEINGVINFDITVLKGLKIEISFPVF